MPPGNPPGETGTSQDMATQQGVAMPPGNPAGDSGPRGQATPPAKEPAMKTGLVYEDFYLKHQTGAGHPETPERLKVILAPEGNRPGGKARPDPGRAAPMEWITSIHSPEYVAIHVAGFIDDTNRIMPRVIPDDDRLQAVSSVVFFPLVGGQELLQVSRGNPRSQGDRLTAFFAQIGQLTLDIGRKMSPRIPSGKAIVELFQVPREHRFQSANLFGIHAKPSMLDGYSFAKLADLRNINLAL